jgi:SAM-dependent methyltransferase
MKKIPLVCPCINKCSLKIINQYYLCTNLKCEHSTFENAFVCNGSIPILISETRTDTVCISKVKKIYIKRLPRKYHWLQKLIRGESAITKINCNKFVDRLKGIKNPKVLVIGAGEKGSGTDELWHSENIEIHAVDIYATNLVDVICDAHYLPLENDYYDGVWIQAVLEHVVEPNVVVSEIYRVLKQNGIVYAETPFMQQVHEGAYDFNRYTVLGHRWLFKKFELIDFGGIQGADVVLEWSLRYFTWAITGKYNLGRLFGFIFGILIRPFRVFVIKESLFDSASGVFFMGKKVPTNYLSHKNLISLYNGLYENSR